MSDGVPKWLEVNPDGIPDELKRLFQWVTWAFEARVDGEQPTKIPYSPRGLPRRAKANDPRTWGDFSAAMKCYTRRDGFAGIGFQFAADGGLVGVDLDKCRDPDSGELAEWAADIVKRFNTYAEVSPSGTGVKLWCRGKIPGDGKGKKRPFGTGAVEMYGRGRYFAVTGHILESSPPTIRDAQAEIEWLWEAAFAERSRIRENSRVNQSGSRIRENSGCNPQPRPDFSQGRLQASSVSERARRYIAKMPPAISGQGGHDQTFAVACALVLGFDLTPDQAFPLLAEYSQRCEPPWSEAELRHKLDDAGQQPGQRGYLRDAQRDGHAADCVRAGAVGAGYGQNSHEFCYTEIDPKSIFTAEGRTDLTNAMRFVADNHPNIAWCSQWAGWLIWDSRRWAPELRCESMAMAQSTFRRLWSQVGPQIARAGSKAQVSEALRWAAYTASTHGIAAMLAQAKPHLATIPDMYDLDPWLLNCPNGTLDLRTATLREHRREDHLTKLCPTDYRPGAECPTWLEFLDTIFAGDRATIDYLQRLCGYWLTGDVREQILPIFWGDGSNGKSTFVDAIKEVLGGDYAITADRSLIVAREREGHSTERMDLFGRRLAVVTETDDCQRFAEAAVKELTGGDAIRGRRIRENTWEYKPTHKLLLVTNHKPRVRATDHAFWRRPKLIDFAVTIPDEGQDKVLPAKLKAEASGILAWAVRGCLRWQQSGLAEPESVQKATRAYRSDEDTLRQFIAECCVTDNRVQVKLSVLRERYAQWCKERGEREFSSRRFGEYLKSAGFENYHSGGTWYRGIGVSGDAHGGQIEIWSERGAVCDVT